MVRLLEKLTGLAQSDPDGYIASLRHFAEASQKPAGNLECFEVIRDLKDIMTVSRCAENELMRLGLNRQADHIRLCDKE